MAILKQRLSKRMPDGSLTPVHLETSSDLVLRPDGTTAEANFVTLVDEIEGFSKSIVLKDNMEHPLSLSVGNLRPIPGYCAESAFRDLGKGSASFGYSSNMDKADTAPNAISEKREYPNKVSGSCSIAAGIRNKIHSSYCIAVGDYNMVMGQNSAGFGGFHRIDGTYSAAFGMTNYAGGDYNLVTGRDSRIAGECGLSGGLCTVNNGVDNIAFGEYNMLGAAILRLTNGTVIDTGTEYEHGGRDYAYDYYYTVRFTVDTAWFNGIKSTDANQAAIDTVLQLNGKSSNPSSSIMKEDIVYFPGRRDRIEFDFWCDDFQVIDVSDDGSSITIKFNARTPSQIEDSFFTSSNDSYLVCMRGRDPHNNYGTIFEVTGSAVFGISNIVTGRGSAAFGIGTIACADTQVVIGNGNKPSENKSDRFIVGKGTLTTYAKPETCVTAARSNCFRVTDTGVYASGNYNASGADYAEMFEWVDDNPDNEDRVGRFVTLDGDKIRLATSADDFILGVVSGNPSIVGDVHDDQWQGMYLYDIYGRPLFETVEIPEWIEEVPDDPENPASATHTVTHPAHTETRQKLNPEYNNTEKYRSRSSRPEWAAVGLMGKLVVNDDGTARINEYVTVADGGIATNASVKTKYRVMKRLDDTRIQIMIIP
ncbi:MAG: hypothetical protein NC311_06365 [Muribaculaceae bacterium]|nr:hypothetical protein [Muribaculaceae bacterium]